MYLCIKVAPWNQAVRVWSSNKAINIHTTEIQKHTSHNSTRTQQVQEHNTAIRQEGVSLLGWPID